MAKATATAAVKTEKKTTKTTSPKASASTPSQAKTVGNLSPAIGSNVTNKRKGRGIGSGLGKTAGKGHKGQRARKSGNNYGRGFEGGQMPLYRRLPKRGFTSTTQIQYEEVNLDKLLKLDGKQKITPELLAAEGLIRSAKHPVKLLGRGNVEKALTISVHKVSAAAKAAVEKAGGKVEEI